MHSQQKNLGRNAVNVAHCTAYALYLATFRSILLPTDILIPHEVTSESKTATKGHGGAMLFKKSKKCTEYLGTMHPYVGQIISDNHQRATIVVPVDLECSNKANHNWTS